MRRVRRLARETPASRERYVDLLRAIAIGTVVLGHWLITEIERTPDGRITGHSALSELPWAEPVTWLAQVMPVFFLVGGYANAASLTSRWAHGGDSADWLRDRGTRLVRPSTALVLALTAAAVLASALGAAPEQVRTVVWFATIPLWFLSAYLTVVLLTPPMYALHRRFGLAVPLVLTGLVGIGDLARLHGPSVLGLGNFVFGWLAMHQVGFAWRTGQLSTRPRVAVSLLLGGLAAVMLLTLPGPYPVSMLDVPGQRLRNASPPTLALLAVATAQLGLVLLLRGPARRWLCRQRPWEAVVAVNTVTLTVFLWHMTAAILLIGALNAVGLLPTPRANSPGWLLWRLPWLIMLIMVLVGLVAIVGRIEWRRPERPDRRHRPAPRGAGMRMLARPAARRLLAVTGFGAVVFGLVGNSLAPRSSAEPLGLPVMALVSYLTGAALLRLLRVLPPSSP